jgi:hypothetical protein
MKRAPLAWAAVAAVLAALLAACSGGGSSEPPPAAPAPPPAPPPPPPALTLQQRAAAFPAMPKDLTALAAVRGVASLTFGSGTPYNDVEYTLLDTDYMEGETHGYDTFMPVDPSAAAPGADTIKIVNGSSNVDFDVAYSGQRGDRIVLGTAEIALPFFSRGSDGIDNDYAVITNFNFALGHVQLRGSAADYTLLRCTLADGCKTDGWYLFHTAGSEPDLIAFFFRCDDVALNISGATPRNPKALCNSNEALSLADNNQFRFAQPVSTVVALPGQATQFGSRGKELVGGLAVDAQGNRYVVGQTDGSNGSDSTVFVTRIDADGTRRWSWELPLPNGSLLFDAAADGEHLYAVGRTLGALPGQRNAGRWDAIIVKLRLADGVLVASNQWGNEGLDGYGNVVLDDAGHLYVSGAGSPAGASGTDDRHLVAKHRTADLANVWRQIVAPEATGEVRVSEAWGGLSYVPGALPGQGRLVAGGWFMGGGAGSTSANGFLEVWAGLHEATPTRVASTVIASAGVQADWVLDNAVDAAGRIYAVGFTTGSLQGAARGQGDAFVVRYDADLRNPVFRQVGGAFSEGFRRMAIDPAGRVFAVGYTAGDLQGSNADPTRATADVWVHSFDAELNPLALRQFGTPHEDRAVLRLQGGALHLAGSTEGALGGPSAGSFDAFVLRADLTTLMPMR